MDVNKFNEAFRPLCLARHTNYEFDEFIEGRFCAASKFQNLEKFLNHEDIIYKVEALKHLPSLKRGEISIRVKIMYIDPKMRTLTVRESFSYKDKSWGVSKWLKVNYLQFTKYFLKDENHLENNVTILHRFMENYDSILIHKIPLKTIINLIYFN